MSLIVRESAAGDARYMAEILNEIIEIGGTTAIEEPVAPEFFEEIIGRDDPLTFSHSAFSGKMLVGFQWIEPYPSLPSGVAGIATFVKVDGTQSGIGRALFAATKDACKKAGYTEIDATIRGDNTGGLNYYSKMGFVDHAVTVQKPLSSGLKVDRIHKRFPL